MSELINVEMSDFWNGDGGEKWLRFQNSFDASLETFGQKAMTKIKIKTAEHVLDIGCGCGDTSVELTRQVGTQGYVLGIDISNILLRQAYQRSAQTAQRNIHFMRADAQSHVFKENSFDVVFSRFGVMFFDDPVAAFSNIRRALKPNGRMIFICWQNITANQWVNLPLEVAANHISIPAVTSADTPGAFSFGHRDKVSRILTAAGFINIEIEQFDSKFNVGVNIDQAITFLTQIGPLSNILAESEFDNITRDSIIHDLSNTLVLYKKSVGVELDAAMWIVSARK